MPMNAIFTRSLALISGEVGRTRPWAGVQNDGMADTADKASARLRNERREISSDFHGIILFKLYCLRKH